MSGLLLGHHKYICCDARSNVEIAGKLYDEIVANVPGAIIQTSVGEPGEMSSPDQAKLISFKVQDLIISEKRYGTSNSILMIFCISPSLSLGPFF